ncbi:MAG: IS3 family transposase [Leptonema illini]|uniref:IS3 family transposase n=1 Tax=Leptonema illini TaxID=183 RepID=A0A833GZP3_9LEPT|nr:MAG: IS3 family transposase [Leptonema illini]
MKNELDREPFADEDEAKCKIFDYIEVFYNRKRGHSYSGIVLFP